jgi:UDP-glucuronate 4-epimerase
VGDNRGRDVASEPDSKALRIFLTGSAGFIGMHLARRLLGSGHQVFGYDGLTCYYDVRLKRERLAQLEPLPGFFAGTGLLEDQPTLAAAYREAAPEIVIHLAAQAGVRNPLSMQRTYLDANLTGTFNLLELCREAPPRHLLFASSSSVYGQTDGSQSRETDNTDRPISLYAATKKSGEAMTYSYAHLFGLPVTALRFFTVYGPWGRPDMALFKFVDAIENDRPITLFGEGRMQRDFTYIDDNIDAVAALVDLVPKRNEGAAPWRVLNIAGGQPVPLMRFISAIEAATGKRALIDHQPMQPGDVGSTSADATALQALTGRIPTIPVEEGITRFVAWYREWTKTRGS